MTMEILWQAVFAILISMAGRLAAILNSKSMKKPQKWWIIGQLFVAGFAGGMTLLLSMVAGWSGPVIQLVCGISGWTSPLIVYAITGIVERILGLDENSLSKKKGNGRSTNG